MSKDTPKTEHSFLLRTVSSTNGNTAASTNGTTTASTNGNTTASTKEKTVDAALNGALEGAGFGWGNVRLLAGAYITMASNGAQIELVAVLPLLMGLTTEEVFLVQAIATLGQVVGPLLFSTFSDRYGRRSLILLTFAASVTTGALSGAAVGYQSFMLARFVVGIFLGATKAPMTAMILETVPMGLRVAAYSGAVGVNYIGQVVALLLCWSLYPVGGWSSIMVVCSLVFLPGIPIILWSEESPRFDVMMGRGEAARDTIVKLYRYNNQEIGREESEMLETLAEKKGSPDSKCPGHTAEEWASAEEGVSAVSAGFWEQIKSPGVFRDIILVSLYGLVVKGITKGTMYASPLIIDAGVCSSLTNTSNALTVDTQLTVDDMELLGLTALFSPVGAVIATVACEMMGRRPTAYVTALLFLVLNCFFYRCVSTALLYVALACVRVFIVMFDILGDIVGAEYFPTTIRGFTSSMNVAAGRVGMIVSIYVVQYGFEESPVIFTGYVQGLAAVFVVVVFCLTKETRGRQLENS